MDNIELTLIVVSSVLIALVIVFIVVIVRHTRKVSRLLDDMRDMADRIDTAESNAATDRQTTKELLVTIKGWTVVNETTTAETKRVVETTAKDLKQSLESVPSKVIEVITPARVNGGGMV